MRQQIAIGLAFVLVACGGVSTPARTAAGPTTASPSAIPLAADAQGQQDERAYTEGPVTEVDYLRVEYGRFEEYIAWLNSTWKPTMEATKKAGLIVGYGAYRATPKSPDQPNVFLMITFKNMAALDKGVEIEAVARKVIGSTDVQNKARVGRNDYRKVLGIELIRELVLK